MMEALVIIGVCGVTLAMLRMTYRFGWDEGLRAGLHRKLVAMQERRHMKDRRCAA